MNQKAFNLFIARIVPVILIGLVGYVTWIVVVQICGRVSYLLHPLSTAPRARRSGAAIAILIIYFILLALMAVCYLRLLQTVVTNPGYVPRSTHWYQQQKQPKQTKVSSSNSSQEKPKRKTWHSHSRQPEFSEGEGSSTGGSFYPNITAPASGLENFYTKDVFVCQNDGRPIWCSTCLNWKPDRAHHCREVERCVRKMDHFCPWVGGIVSETNFKFFLQFVTYGTLYCIFVGVFMAIFVAEKRRAHEELNIHWILALAFAILFGLFGAGMTGGTLQLILMNSTTVENLSRKTRVTYLAVHIPRPDTSGALLSYRTITYPLRPHVPANELPAQPAVSETSQTNTNVTTSTSTSPSTTPPRTFAILATAPGINPWNLGFLTNFQEVMGYHPWDWFLPLKYSPCCNHSSGESDFPLGPVVDRLRKEAGISVMIDTQADASEHSPSRRRKRRRRGDEEPSVG
ncbi:MAG: palmitoyltransferase pfa5 [Candelina submexicana]|nr:MAG: palmitoyltransferase pfa5 [Candelina submexicana]